MSIEIDLEKIKEYAEKRKEENFRFRSFLKFKDSKEIDSIVHQLNKEVSEAIDCTQCGNCCRWLQPSVKKQDIRRISGTLGISNQEFYNEYVEMDEEGVMYLRQSPCSFLEANKCTIYENRPDDCKFYPNLHKNDFTAKLLSVIDNYGVCPIVFNVFEQLKQELDFK